MPYLRTIVLLSVSADPFLSARHAPHSPTVIPQAATWALRPTPTWQRQLSDRTATHSSLHEGQQVPAPLSKSTDRIFFFHSWHTEGKLCSAWEQLHSQDFRLCYPAIRHTLLYNHKNQHQTRRKKKRRTPTCHSIHEFFRNFHPVSFLTDSSHQLEPIMFHWEQK